MLITRNNNWANGYRRRTVAKEFKVGPMSLKFITIALVAVAALFYLAQSTQSSSQKYQIMQLSDTKNELLAKEKDLEVEAARLKSLNEIKKSSQDTDLVPSDQADFLKQ